jgi:hypothetical protein
MVTLNKLDEEIEALGYAIFPRNLHIHYLQLFIVVNISFRNLSNITLLLSDGVRIEQGKENNSFTFPLLHLVSFLLFSPSPLFFSVLLSCPLPPLLPFLFLHFSGR